MYDLNTTLIEEMKIRLPKDENLANFLMDTLFLGKEATYRRLRGDVPFTFIEVAAISQNMGISIDKIVGLKKSDNNSIFNMNLFNYQHPIDSYYSKIDSCIKLFEEIIKQNSAELVIGSNSIPQTLYLKYKSLAKFRLLKWMYQFEKTFSYQNYEDILINDSLLEKQEEVVRLAQSFPVSTYIFDEEIFIRLFKELKFFHEISLVSTESLEEIKSDIYALLNELEQAAALGKFQTNKEVKIYISNISFESNYCYIESNNFQESILKIFTLNSITSKDDLFFKNLKAWTQSLKKYSILISQSGEVQRRIFFKKQREIFDKL